MNGADIFFVDSNVLLYYVDPVEPQKRERATDWLNHLWLAGLGRLSWQVLHEFYSNAVRKLRLDSSHAREIVEDLSEWRPVDSSLGLIRDAWQWVDAARISYWDALILAAAERSGARYLLTEDFQQGRSFGVIEILDPFKNPPSEFFS